MNIGLFFGSFNPIHVGHLIIANYFVEHTDLNEVWFIVSPQNPFKEKKTLLNEYHRLEMVRLAIGDNVRLRASDIEFKMPQPSYTVDTLAVLSEKHPNYNFSLIMGSDNLENLHKWKNAEQLTSNHTILVYARPDYTQNPYSHNANVQLHNPPQMSLSSTYIRKQLGLGKSIQYLVPDTVLEFIKKGNYYTN